MSQQSGNSLLVWLLYFIFKKFEFVSAWESSCEKFWLNLDWQNLSQSSKFKLQFRTKLNEKLNNYDDVVETTMALLSGSVNFWSINYFVRKSHHSNLIVTNSQLIICLLNILLIEKENQVPIL